MHSKKTLVSITIQKMQSIVQHFCFAGLHDVKQKEIKGNNAHKKLVTRETRVDNRKWTNFFSFQLSNFLYTFCHMSVHTKLFVGSANPLKGGR